MSPQSNHNKIKDLFFATVIAVPCFFLVGNQVNQTSNSILKEQLKCEELETGNRGYIRGIVTERKKSQWSNQQEAALAESNSCSTIVTFSPNDKAAGFFRPGAKLKVAVKVDSDYSASLLNSNVKRDYTIISLDGTLPKTQTTIKKLAKSLIPDRDKSWTLYLNSDDYNHAVYYFPKEITSKLKPNVKQKWYYHAETENSKSYIVSDVETIEN